MRAYATDLGLDFPKCAALLRQCTGLASLRELHHKIAAANLDAHTFLGNHLVQMYGKCGNTAEALLAFERIRNKNRFSWNIVLTAYAQNGHILESKFLFEKMPQRDLYTWNSMIAALAQNGCLEDAFVLAEKMPEKDTVSWNTILAAYSESGNLPTLKTMFDRMEKRNAVSWNAIISGYGQNNSVELARKCLAKMPQRNLLSWNAMLAAYAQNGYFAMTVKLFAEMCAEGFEPDAFTCVSVLDACDRSLGEEIHDEARFNGWDSSVFVGTALVAMYGRCQCVERAKEVFGSMPERNIVSWNAMLTAYAENGHLEDTMAVYKHMPARDLASGNGLVSGYARLGQWESARAAFWALPERDVVSWNTMIAACVERDRPQESLALFREMDLDGVAPNRITLASILSACDGSQENIAHALIAGLRDLEPDAMIGTALVILYGRCGSCEKSLEIFHQMEEPHDPGAWNSIIAALARNGHTDAAIAMLRRLECEGIEPDFAVFNSILFACSHGGSLREGYAHFLIMAGDYGIAASASHFMCLIDLLGRAGKLEAAEELIDSMPFEADGLAWTILLSSCKSHNDVERGAMAAMRVAEFESWQSSTYVMLSSIMRN